MLHAHGNDFLMKLFGPKAKNQLAGMGGIDKVAVALSRKFSLWINVGEVEKSTVQSQVQSSSLRAYQ